ncbi:carboxypeptidase-like regulatory domain-containing protein [Nocardioides sp. TF02-7]|uniref:carboxypeptidase-like regulatory domain-containing protein n=1 Tax=Nocardioides sp. TF02-7 TaxID=2917724 RepID=UPI001F05DEFA|nr:carboxypeptidase-like regulatory domain-containing protein [Nocardioides sp. TF02-7]UMG91030.1 carboxypeptidase regulatory-like domain-containing protein [Nocardioides sp. TF02-7]
MFLFGLVNVFAGDPLTKTAPPSYFNLASASTDGADDAGDGADGADGGTGPASALPKTGLLPPGVGGQIAGTVHAASDDSPVGRILVIAYREGRGGRLVPVSSGATQSDGSYTLAGLFPTDYRLKFSAKGYDEVWYPDARRAGGAEPVTAEAQTSVGPVDVTIDGQQGSISGVVEQGDTQPVPTQVTARLLDGSEGTTPAARTVTDADGGYELTGLRAPGTYEISFVADGYRAASVVQRLAGGEDRIQPAVVLSAGGGEVSGTVRGEDGPLGGVTVTTDVGGQPVSVVTPTAGTVGAFSLQDLPTPGTYVVTFSAEGYGEHVEIIDLGPGESRTGFDQRLEAGSGSVTGVVRGPGGKPLGNVEVVVGGAVTTEGTAPTSTTLTTGSVGSYALNDLPVPGDYTLTFTAPGFAPETRPFSLTAEDPSETPGPGADHPARRSHRQDHPG